MARIVSINAEAYLGGLKKELARLTTHVMGGGCTDFAEYRAKAGEARGLNQAIENFNKVINGGDDNDD